MLCHEKRSRKHAVEVPKKLQENDECAPERETTALSLNLLTIV